MAGLAVRMAALAARHGEHVKSLGRTLSSERKMVEPGHGGRIAARPQSQQGLEGKKNALQRMA
jgi:hypothetical protein